MLNKKEILKNRVAVSKINKSMVVIFKALSDVNRYRIFYILIEHPELSVSTLAHILNISLPLTSQHIKVLEHAGLLQKQRVGKRIFTKLEHDDPLAQCIIKTTKCIIKITKASYKK